MNLGTFESGKGEVLFASARKQTLTSKAVLVEVGNVRRRRRIYWTSNESSGFMDAAR